jgi:hypothetical protein
VLALIYYLDKNKKGDFQNIKKFVSLVLLLYLSKKPGSTINPKIGGFLENYITEEKIKEFEILKKTEYFKRLVETIEKGLNELRKYLPLKL